jgi:hypothetical protein
MLTACGSQDESRSSPSSATEARPVDSASSSQPIVAPSSTSAPATSIGSTATSVGSQAQPFLGSLRFDWPVGCSVPVEENVTKRGQTALLNYFVRSEQADAGIEISFEEMTIREVNGTEVPEDVADQIAAQFMLPGFLVGADGVETGVVGTEEMIAQMDDAGLIEADDFTPQALALLEETVLSKYWGSWVGFWAGLESIDEPRSAREVPLSVGESEVTIDLVVESLVNGSTKEATLRSVQTLTGEDFLRSIGAVETSLGKEQSAGSEPEGDGHRISTVEVTTDPATLQPRSVSFVNDIELTMDGATQTDIESRDWRFDWSATRCS